MQRTGMAVKMLLSSQEEDARGMRMVGCAWRDSRSGDVAFTVQRCEGKGLDGR